MAEPGRTVVSNHAGSVKASPGYTKPIRGIPIDDGKDDNNQPPQQDVILPTNFHRQDGKLIAWFNAGGFEVFPGMNEKTWKEWIDVFIMPLYERGVRRFWLHNVMGQWGERVSPERENLVPERTGMMFKQALLSKRFGINDVDGFAEAWAPFTEAGCEVIAYVGAPGTEDNRSYMEQALEPFLLSGCTIGLDATSSSAIDSPRWEKLQVLRYDLGARIILEALPQKSNPHLKGQNACCIYRFWRRNIENADNASRFWTPAERREAGGESIVIAGSHEWPAFETPQEEVEFSKKISDMGYTIGSRFWNLNVNPDQAERLEAFMDYYNVSP